MNNRVRLSQVDAPHWACYGEGVTGPVLTRVELAELHDYSAEDSTANRATGTMLDEQPPRMYLPAGYYGRRLTVAISHEAWGPHCIGSQCVL